MTDQERRERARRIVEALERLPDAQAEYILGFAEGVIAAEERQKKEATA